MKAGESFAKSVIEAALGVPVREHDDGSDLGCTISRLSIRVARRRPLK
jgi:hypothetical protein